MRLLARGAFLGIATILFGQQQANRPEQMLPERARELLQSPVLVDRAWGAYLCGSLLVKGCETPLVEALERAAEFVAAPVDGEEFFYVQGLLDSLIRLETAVPPALVLTFDPRWRDEVIILLARSPNPEAALLRLEEQKDLTDNEWIAVSNLLLGVHSRPFFLRMLEQTRISHSFYIYDDERVFGTPGMIGDHFYPGKVLRKVPMGFPPVGIYELNGHGSGRRILLATGPCAESSMTTYSRIEIHAAGTNVTPRHRYPANRSIECRNAYLAGFNSMPIEAAREILRPHTKIRWTNAARFVQETNAAIEKQERDLRWFIVKAGVSGPLTIPIHTGIVDDRQVKSPRLPELRKREVRLD